MAMQFEYDEKRQCEIADYRGLEITAQKDEDAENPLEAWDGLWPMLVHHSYDRNSGVKLYDKTKSDIESPLSYFSDGQLIRHQKALCAVFDRNCYWMAGHNCAGDLQEHVDDYRDTFGTMADCKREFFDECINDISDSDMMNAYQELFHIISIPCLNTSSTGYCQGDYAEMLIVMTPEAQKQIGYKAVRIDDEAAMRDMQAQADLYSAWAWGDVYYFTIEKDGETLEACGEYYGTDHTETGLAETALGFADTIIATATENRHNRLKQLIKAGVPLHLRGAELAAAGEIAA